jgi:hypothetical protein
MLVLAASRLIGHLLFSVSANDPVTLAAVAFVLAAVAALAGFLDFGGDFVSRFLREHA